MQPDPTRLANSKRKPPPNYFSRGEQYRLFLLVSMLMLVLIMMNEARKPKTWAWMWDAEKNDRAAMVSDDAPIDTRISSDSTRPLPVDGFVALAPKKDNTPPEFGDLLPGLTPELLAELKDDTVMRASETKTWLAVFAALRAISQEELEDRSIGNVGFLQLFRQTDLYRGKLVTISGIVQRLERIVAQSNDIGVENYYRWIVNPQGGSNSPIVIYSLEKPDELTVGEDLREHVEITGVCYKRWVYLAGDGTRIAPLLLARSATWQPPTKGPAPWSPTRTSLLTIFFGMTVMAALIAVGVYYVSGRVTPEIARLRASNQSRIGPINDDQVLPSVSNALNRLAEQDDTGRQS